MKLFTAPPAVALWSAICGVLCFGTSSIAFGQLGEKTRPSKIQAEVDHVFERVASDVRYFRKSDEVVRTEGWLYNGEGFYSLMGFDERKILRDLGCREVTHSEAPIDDDVYIMDLGAASGGWGIQAEKFINRELAVCDRKFHIFSITGSLELDEQVVTVGRVTHHRLNRFRIENLNSELAARGYDLRGRFDLIVSNWTLRHLVDPFGTLEEMYELLSPSNGTLMTSGFYFSLRDVHDQPMLNERQQHRIFSTRGFWRVFARTSAQFVFRPYDRGGDLDHFMLIRTSNAPLGIPLEYTNEVGLSMGRPNWIASKRVCHYRLKEELVEAKGLMWHGTGTEEVRYYDRYYGGLQSLATFIKFELFNWMVLEKLPKAAL